MSLVVPDARFHEFLKCSLDVRSAKKLSINVNRTSYQIKISYIYTFLYYGVQTNCNHRVVD